MDRKLIREIICPYCSAELDIKKGLIYENEELTWGLLQCQECINVYPVVESIPIIMHPEKKLHVHGQTTKTSIVKEGISVKRICTYIEDNDLEKIRNSLIYSIPYASNIPTNSLLGKLGQKIARQRHRLPYLRYLLNKKLKNSINNGDDNTTTYKAMRSYYRSHELFNYFFYKFGQPRFLSCLGLATIIENAEKPILDLACGQGHLMHFLTYAYSDVPVIGMDRNFFQLFLAKKFIAPRGHYICAHADNKLPFRDNFFKNAICSDAFHYFRNKLSCVNDLKKVVGSSGTIILARVGNRNVPPNEGEELTPKGYLELFGSMKAKLISEDEVLERYLKKLKPNLSDINKKSFPRERKWLSIVASGNNSIFKDHSTFTKWPHALGYLDINPLYKKVGKIEQDKELYRFAFPSEWYEFENAQWMKYAPKKVLIPENVQRALSNNTFIPTMKRLIEDFVILGFPGNYK